jgi:hypothetical protein
MYEYNPLPCGIRVTNFAMKKQKFIPFLLLKYLCRCQQLKKHLKYQNEAK